MKHTSLIIAILMGASFTLAVPALVKDVIQGPVEPLDVIHSKLLKALNISVPGAGPELADIPVPFDGAVVKTRGLSEVQCDIFPPEETLMPAPPAGVRSTIEQLRARTDEPPAIGSGCEPVICSDSAGIILCSHPENSTLTWSVIADAAQAMLDKCGSDGSDFTAGAFYDEGWAAVVYHC